MELHLRKQGDCDFGKPRGEEQERRALAEMREPNPQGKAFPGPCLWQRPLLSSRPPGPSGNLVWRGLCLGGLWHHRNPLGGITTAKFPASCCLFCISSFVEHTGSVPRGALWLCSRRSCCCKIEYIRSNSPSVITSLQMLALVAGDGRKLIPADSPFQWVFLLGQQLSRQQGFLVLIQCSES